MFEKKENLNSVLVSITSFKPLGTKSMIGRKKSRFELGKNHSKINL